MKNILAIGFYLILLSLVATAQTSGLHIPTDKPLKPRELAAAWTNPPIFCLLLHFDAGRFHDHGSKRQFDH